MDDVEMGYCTCAVFCDFNATEISHHVTNFSPEENSIEKNEGKLGVFDFCLFLVGRGGGWIMIV